MAVQFIDIQFWGTDNHLWQCGFLYLSHNNTLVKYNGYTDNQKSCNPDVLSKFLNYVGLELMKPRDHNIALLFGEICVKSAFVFSKATRNLFGFCDMGNVNDELNKIWQVLERVARSRARNLCPDINGSRFIQTFQLSSCLLCFRF